ncbi:ABC transporter permease [Streptomyces sp. YGL11-2]|uniref:ABC transporter permease n=1 Tax=Streptomyces sp. YGL11-2 TaxID=3414028 RepID=UPI003CFB8326
MAGMTTTAQDAPPRPADDGERPGNDGERPASGAPGARRGRRRLPYGRLAVLAPALLYFLVPVAASVWFTVDDPVKGLTLDVYTGHLISADMAGSLLLSVELGLTTVVLGLLLVVPAMVVVHLRLPRLRPLLEILCMTPLVVPPIALVAGVNTVLSWAPDLARTPFYETLMAIQNENFPLVLVLLYTVMSLPFLYRSLDAGLRAVDLGTLVEASRSLGASRLVTLWRVVLPNLRGAVVGGAVLSLAMVLGEYTVASVLGYRPFAVWMVEVGGQDAELAGAAAMLSLLLTWGLLLLLTTVAGGRARRAGEQRKNA